MTHVVTQSCCGDGSCVFACPVNAIHPTPDEPDFATADMLYIDPVSCVDCGACVTACPVGAITPAGKLATAELAFVEVNALFHEVPRNYPPQAPVTPIVAADRREVLRVAIVGAGPAAMYAADELLKRPGTEVNVFDRLPTPYGLVRAGVAPDHHRTKSIEDLFRQIEDQPGFTYFLNVDVGREVSHRQLAGRHHAVLYATGAAHDRRLNIVGEDLPGSATATAFVGWYNGHPDHADHTFDLDTERVVIVGNGNVALDVARILTSDPQRLASTDIADHALAALSASRVREVVLVARRGAAHAAFTLPELIGLVSRDDIDIVVEGDPLVGDGLDTMAKHKIKTLRAAAERPTRAGVRRVVFRFAASPMEFAGQGEVEHVELCRNNLIETDGEVRAVPTSETERLATRLVLRSVGYRGARISGLPFDEERGVVPHESGRVTDAPGVYVAGWIKRGPSGFIGTNKSCARETVDQIVSDFNACRLPTPHGTHADLVSTVRSEAKHVVDLLGWRGIDDAERQSGVEVGRPRRKISRINDLLDIAIRTPERRQRRRIFATR